MPARRPRGNDLRAIDAFKRIHSAVSEPGFEGTALRGERGRSAGAQRPEAPRPGAPRPEPGRRRSIPDLTGLTSRPGRVGRAANPDRPRPPGPVLIAAAVMAALALITLAVARLGFGSTPASPAASRPPPAGHPAATTRTTVPVTTRPTVPSRYSPQSSTASGASYAVPTPTFSVAVATTAGPCWVEVGPGPGGPFSFASTIPVGGQQTFPASGGSLWVLLGAPGNVTVTVGGVPVDIAPAASSPFDLTFTST